MKRLIIPFFSIIFIFSCNTPGSETTATGKEIEADEVASVIRNPVSAAVDIDPTFVPVMTFDEVVYDFGEVKEGTKVEHTFKFENTGEGPLIFHDVKPSSGCTALKNWPKGVLKPGSKGEINIEFTPNIEGNTTKTISIVTNANPSVIKLTLKKKRNYRKS